uniref:Ecdysis triggering hormone n=1 Tax=Stomoxys calcitrans TaxID=35570 RepID=A0A1I8PVS5_STOCA
MRGLMLLLYALLLYLYLGTKFTCQADESSGFFVKVTKNVPRLGRRSDKDVGRGLFRNYKIVPRIGRSAPSASDYHFLSNWLTLQSPRTFDKRTNSHLMENSIARELNVVQPVNSNTLMELITKHAIPNENVKFIHWKDFDKALQMDTELYVKVSSLGRTPDQRLRNDITEGNYVPFMDDMVDDQGIDFMIYNQGDYPKGPYAPEFLRYNSL